MGDGADMARDRQWDAFCINDIFTRFPRVRNPWDLPMEFMKEGVICLLEDISFQIRHNAKSDVWYQKSGNKVKISEMDDNYKNTIVKFLEKKKIKVPKQFLMEG